MCGRKDMQMFPVINESKWRRIESVLMGKCGYGKYVRDYTMKMVKCIGDDSKITF